MREDWIESSLGEVCKITLGQSPLSTDCNNQKIGLPFFQGKAEFTNKYPIPRVWCAKPKKIANADSILLSVRAPVGSINVAFEKCGIGRGLAALEYDLCQDFILFYLKAIKQELDSKGTGTTFRAISGDILRNQKIPLPPLPEQRAIVKKLESLLSSLDAGVADLKKAQQQLKIYRQAVLKKAFENIKSEISLEEIKQDSLIGLVKSNAEQNATIGAPYIKMNNINMDGGTDIKNVVYVDASASEIEKYSLRKGDILINTRNSYGLVGKSGIIKSDLDNYTFNNNLMRLRLKSGINPFFVFYQIIGPSMRKMMIAEKKATTSICALYQRDIFPLKAKMIENIEEQNEIVKQIESRLSVCDSIEQNIKESLEKAEALRQSILKKAFEGSLLSAQELAECKLAKDYEPANVLLDRINKK